MSILNRMNWVHRVLVSVVLTATSPLTVPDALAQSPATGGTHVSPNQQRAADMEAARQGRLRAVCPSCSATIAQAAPTSASAHRVPGTSPTSTAQTRATPATQTGLSSNTQMSMMQLQSVQSQRQQQMNMTTNIVGSISQSQKTVAENIGGGGGGGGATAHAACPTCKVRPRPH
jgi:hypothetical protein